VLADKSLWPLRKAHVRTQVGRMVLNEPALPGMLALLSASLCATVACGALYAQVRLTQGPREWAAGGVQVTA
jgi:hypothetical protein